jgi:hypothetical protein
MNYEDEKRFQQIIKQLFGEDALEKDIQDSQSFNSDSEKMEEELKVAIEMAKYELNELRDAFINFQKQIKDLVL